MHSPPARWIVIGTACPFTVMVPPAGWPRRSVAPIAITAPSQYSSAFGTSLMSICGTATVPSICTVAV